MFAMMFNWTTLAREIDRNNIILRPKTLLNLMKLIRNVIDLVPVVNNSEIQVVMLIMFLSYWVGKPIVYCLDVTDVQGLIMIVVRLLLNLTI